ncbi:hypothetical protein CDL60_26735 [Roseateles noduli]|nr:hypothetical protein CDL60_26735 [Roseateles noduli]
MDVVSEYSEAPPAEAGRVKIVGPIYALDRVQRLAEDPERILMWTLKSQRDIEVLFESDTEELARVVRTLAPQHYRNSEWCTDGRNRIAACDAYCLDRKETTAAGSTIQVQYFLKFAIDVEGMLLLLVSCHLSN